MSTEREWSVIVSILVVVMVVSFGIGAAVILAHKKVPSQSTSNPEHLRNMSRACAKSDFRYGKYIEGGIPEIETIYNKPAGEPGRKPVRWILTCRKK